MYEQAETSINAGLSLGARIVLALFAALFGVVMIAIASPETGSKAVFFYGFGALCLAIAVVCVVRGRVRQFIGSVIGLCILVAGVWYLATQLHAGPLVSGSRSQPSVLNAVLFNVVFGLPSIAYIWRTRFGFARVAP